VLDGQAARGAGSLLGHADINIEMHAYRKDDDEDRRRLLKSSSHFRATPRQLVIEWLADGTDYQARGWWPRRNSASTGSTWRRSSRRRRTS
jgi:hypothetical protein